VIRTEGAARIVHDWFNKIGLRPGISSYVTGIRLGGGPRNTRYAWRNRGNISAPPTPQRTVVFSRAATCISVEFAAMAMSRPSLR